MKKNIRLRSSRKKFEEGWEDFDESAWTREDSKRQQPEESDGEELGSKSDVQDDIEERAEDFIQKFKTQLRLQRLDSILRIREIIPSKSEAPLKIREEQANQHGDTSSNSWSPCIFRTPFPGLGFQEPELVSIGPYHSGKNLPLDKYKYFFLQKFLSRTSNKGKDLCFYVRQMMTLEWRTRKCYSEDLSMTSPDFVEMILVDTCFIIEVLRHFGRSGELEDGDFFFPIEPWRIPILVRDLLSLENQIPFFVLDKLFELSSDDDDDESEKGRATVSLIAMALRFFDLAFPRSLDFTSKFNHLEVEVPEHLLDLFLDTIRPSKPSTNSPSLFLDTCEIIVTFIFNYLLNLLTKHLLDLLLETICPSNPSSTNSPSLFLLTTEKIVNMVLRFLNYVLVNYLLANYAFRRNPVLVSKSKTSATSLNQKEQKSSTLKKAKLGGNACKLRMSGIEFRPRRSDRFTDIYFKNGVLEIPPITVSDLFMAILINCLAYEHFFTGSRCSKDITAYTCFMSGLLRYPADVECLNSDGIMSRFSDQNEKVLSFFDNLRSEIDDGNIFVQDCYLYKTAMEIDECCSSTRVGVTWLRYIWSSLRIVLFCITTLWFTFYCLKRAEFAVGVIYEYLNRFRYYLDLRILVIGMILYMEKPTQTSSVLHSKEAIYMYIFFPTLVSENQGEIGGLTEFAFPSLC